MDAIKFIEERNRMCRFYGCDKCPAKDCACDVLSYMVDDDRIVGIVEDFAASHPRKTRQSVFLEQWPKAIVEYGVLTICPKVVLGREGWMGDGCGGTLCIACRREFWSQEVE